MLKGQGRTPHSASGCVGRSAGMGAAQEEGTESGGWVGNRQKNKEGRAGAKGWLFEELQGTESRWTVGRHRRSAEK